MEDTRLILNKLNVMSADLSYLREHIDDITLTKDDLDSIEEARKDLKLGKTKRL